MRIVPIVLIATVGCPHVAAAETLVRDLRLFGGMGPGTEDAETTASDANETLTVSGDDTSISARDGFRGGAALVGSIGRLGRGGAFGLGLRYTHWHAEQDDATLRAVPFALVPGALRGPIDVTANIFGLEAGWMLPVGSHLHVELMPGAGIGFGTIEDSSLASRAASHETFYWEASVRGGAYWTFANGGQIGGEAGYVFGRMDGEIHYESSDPAGVDVEHEIEVSGPFAQITLGLRW